MKKLLCIAGLVLALRCGAGQTDLNKFIQALNQVETGGKSGKIIGDNGAALGPLQIHYEYWLDSKTPGKYSQVVDYEYSKKVATNYFKLYGREYLARGDWESLARLHNAGLGWKRNKKATNLYWNKVNRALSKF